MLSDQIKKDQIDKGNSSGIYSQQSRETNFSPTGGQLLRMLGISQHFRRRLPNSYVWVWLHENQSWP
jgi:hypothetical protein